MEVRPVKLCYLIVLAVTLFFPAYASATTPSQEEIYRMLLTQQQQIKEQTVRLEALQQTIAEQAIVIAAQEKALGTQEQDSRSQESTITALQQRATKAETELELVQALMATRGATAHPVHGAPRNGPSPGSTDTMTASLEPVPAETAEDESPFSLSIGPEYLVAYSDSFTYLKSEGGMRDTANAQRKQSLGFQVEASYEAPSGLTFGLDYHYWNEPEHAATTFTADSVIVLGPLGIDANNVEAHVDAQRQYADLYASKPLSEASNWHVDLFGGVRAGHFSQNIRVFDLNDPLDWADSSTSYLGAGPMAGLAASWSLLDRLDLVARGDAALLLGESVTDSKSRNGGGVRHRNINRPLDVVWVYTSRLGFDYAIPLDRSRFELELGLNTEYWSGLPDHIRYTDDVDQVGFSSDTDVLFIGPYFDVRYRF